MATVPTICVTPGCVRDKAQTWFNEQMHELMTQMVEGLIGLAGDIATAWVSMPLVPTLGLWERECYRDPVDGVTVCPPPDFQEAEIFTWFAGNLGYFALGFFVLGLMIVGLRMMWTQNGAELRDALRAILIYAIIAGGGTAIVATLLRIGDLFSEHLLKSANDASFEESIASVLMLPTDASNIPDSIWANGALSIIIGIILLLFALLVFITQVLLLVIRGGLLVIMIVMLPVVAAAGTTKVGKSMMSKYLAWLLALILYKPAAAILYAMAFQLAGGEPADDQALLNVITGLTIFVAALFMLPALLRLIVPATQAVASGGGMGGLAAAGAGAAGAMGAMAVKSVMSGGAGTAAAAGSQATKSTGKTTQGGPKGGPADEGGSPPGAGNTGPGGSGDSGPGGSGDSGPGGSGDSGPGGSGDSGPGGSGDSGPAPSPVGGGGASSTKSGGQGAASRTAGSGADRGGAARQSRSGGQSPAGASAKVPGSGPGTRTPNGGTKGASPPGGSRGSASGDGSYLAAPPPPPEGQPFDGATSGTGEQRESEAAQNPWVSGDSPKGSKGSAAAEAARGAVSGAGAQLGETARGAVGEDAEEDGGPHGSN